MKLIRIGIALSVLAILLLTGCDGKSIWYDFGNGKINLDKVSVIRPVMEYQFTDSADAPENVDKTYSEPDVETNVNRLLTLLTKENIGKQDFYRVKFKTYIMFDAFQLGTFESKEYIKKPSVYQVNDFMLAELKNRGASEPILVAVAALKGKQYPSVEAFKTALVSTGQLNMDIGWVSTTLPIHGLGEAGAKFYEETKEIKKENLLDEAGLKELRDGLTASLKSYSEVPVK
jgi:hypothetical protein